MEAEINLYCVACEKTFTSEGYLKKHNNLEHSVDSAEKKLGREKEEKWKIDMINKFRKIYNENGEGVYGELKEMALRYNTLVKKYFGMPKNIPPIKCEKLKDLLHGSFSSIEQHTWIILQHFQDSKPVNLLSSTVNAPSIPSQMDTKYLSESLKNLTPEQLKQVLHIVNDNEGVAYDENEYEIHLDKLQVSTYHMIEFSKKMRKHFRKDQGNSYLWKGNF